MTTTTPLRCANSAMVQRGSSEVVLLDAGAYPGVSEFGNQTWTWNGSDWTNVGTTLFDANGPLPGRLNQCMAFDGYNVMLFGGQDASGLNGNGLGDTWTWGGASWVRKSPATAPFGRHSAKACRSTTSSINVVMFGGYGGYSKLLNETWVWDGYVQTWTRMSPASSPSARVGHVMDSSASVTLLFGGTNSAGECLNDTWTWNGTTWTRLGPTASPPARTGAAMAFDRDNSQWVLFGGMNAYDYLPETWLFNGTTWTKAAPATSPPGLVGAQMCWDTQGGGRVILFGGYSATDGFASDKTWAWDGTNWALL